MATCAACNRRATTLYNLRSLIDFKERRVCIACFCNNAEALEAIVDFDGHVVGQEIQDAIRVYDPDEGDSRYLTIEQWLDRHTARRVNNLAKPRQPAPELEPTADPEPEPCPDPVENEDNAIFGLLAKQKAAIESMPVREYDVRFLRPRRR